MAYEEPGRPAFTVRIDGGRHTVSFAWELRARLARRGLAASVVEAEDAAEGGGEVLLRAPSLDGSTAVLHVPGPAVGQTMSDAVSHLVGELEGRGLVAPSDDAFDESILMDRLRDLGYL